MEKLHLNQVDLQLANFIPQRWMKWIKPPLRAASYSLVVYALR
jgi:hypothetical protein